MRKVLFRVLFVGLVVLFMGLSVGIMIVLQCREEWVYISIIGFIVRMIVLRLRRYYN